MDHLTVNWIPIHFFEYIFLYHLELSLEKKIFLFVDSHGFGDISDQSHTGHGVDGAEIRGCKVRIFGMPLLEFSTFSACFRKKISRSISQSYCLKVKEMDDEEVTFNQLQESLYRVETGNYEYRLVLRCRQLARIRFSQLRSDVSVKLDLLDQKHGGWKSFGKIRKFFHDGHFQISKTCVT